jgi:hypothetical protein
MTNTGAGADTETDAEESIDAVALLRPKRPEALTPFLDLDEDEGENDGIYAEALEDGSFLLFTFQPFAMFASNPIVAQTWLSQFGESLADVHDDPRGILFFPDDVDPESTTYEGVIAEVGDAGAWMPAAGGIDLEMLGALAGELMKPNADGTLPDPSSFDIGRLFTGMQDQLAAAFASAGAEGDDEEDDEEEPSGGPPPKGA